ncbi:MAG: hypothetical protein AAFY08_16160 [Planctomycetota bacterium]
MPDPIEQRIDVTGAEQAAENVDRVSGSTDRLARSTDEAGDRADRAADQQRELRAATRATGDATDRAGDQADRAADQQRELNRAQDEGGRRAGVLGSAVGALRGVFGTLAASLAGAVGVNALLAANTRELRENAQAARDAIQAQRDLAFLTEGFDAGELAFVEGQAVRGGRDPNEVARAFADLRSRTASRTNDQQRALFERAVELGVTTDAPLQSVVGPLINLTQLGLDDLAAQNVLRQTQVEAGVSSPAALGPLFARLGRPAVETGGLAPAEAAALVAASTNLGEAPDAGATSVRAFLLGLSGRGTPQTNELLDAAGVDRSGGFFDDLASLRAAIGDGRFDPDDLEVIGGREGLLAAQAFTADNGLDLIDGPLASIVPAAASPRSVTVEGIESELAGNDRLALDTAISQQRAAVQNTQAADRQAQARELIATLQDRIDRARGVVAPARQLTQAGLGLDAFIARANPFGGFSDEEIDRLLELAAFVNEVAATNPDALGPGRVDAAITTGFFGGVVDPDLLDDDGTLPDGVGPLGRAEPAGVTNVFNGPVVTGANPFDGDTDALEGR